MASVPGTKSSEVAVAKQIFAERGLPAGGPSRAAAIEANDALRSRQWGPPP